MIFKIAPVKMRVFPAQKSSPKGFTLVELLVVIAIIALLAAILFPVFGRARDRARQSTCTSNLRQIYLGLRQYGQDYDGSYPYGQTGSNAGILENSVYRGMDDPKGMPFLLMPYMKSEQIWYCPNMRDSMKDARMPGYDWTKTKTNLINPDVAENATLATPQYLFRDNYYYSTVTAIGATGNPANWPSGSQICPHVSKTNYLFVGYDGRVKLYPWNLAKSVCD